MALVRVAGVTVSGSMAGLWGLALLCRPRESVPAHARWLTPGPAHRADAPGRPGGAHGRARPLTGSRPHRTSPPGSRRGVTATSSSLRPGWAARAPFTPTARPLRNGPRGNEARASITPLARPFPGARRSPTLSFRPRVGEGAFPECLCRGWERGEKHEHPDAGEARAGQEHATRRPPPHAHTPPARHALPRQPEEDAIGT